LYVPKKRVKDRVVTFRMTSDEYERMVAEAAQEGRTLTDHIRIRTLDLDRTFFRWDVEPASKTGTAIPAMMVWSDGSTGQMWQAGNALAAV
jgi:hypothetical protein